MCINSIYTFHFTGGDKITKYFRAESRQNCVGDSDYHIFGNLTADSATWTFFPGCAVEMMVFPNINSHVHCVHVSYLLYVSYLSEKDMSV